MHQLRLLHSNVPVLGCTARRVSQYKLNRFSPTLVTKEPYKIVISLTIPTTFDYLFCHC